MAYRLLETELPAKNGMKLFQKWYKEAERSCPDSFMYFCLSTVDKENKPSSRMLALTGFNESSFRFSTNDYSPKSNDMKLNPCVSLNFYWAPLQKYVYNYVCI